MVITPHQIVGDDDRFTPSGEMELSFACNQMIASNYSPDKLPGERRKRKSTFFVALESHSIGRN